MSDTGCAIFDEKGNPVKIISIPTTSKQEHKDRLKAIADIYLYVMIFGSFIVGLANLIDSINIRCGDNTSIPCYHRRSTSHQTCM